MSTSISTPTIPPRVLARVQHALAALRVWNDAITQARRMEAVAHQPGRYEYDLRYSRDASTVRLRLGYVSAEELLGHFEALTAQHGVDAQAVYASLGGRPVLLEEGPQVQEWRPACTPR